MTEYAKTDAEITQRLYNSMPPYYKLIESLKNNYRHEIKNKIKESRYSGIHKIGGFTINLDNNTYKVHYGFGEQRRAIYNVAKEFRLSCNQR